MSKNAKKGLCLLILAAFAVGVSGLPVVASSTTKNNLENIPQKNGIYDVPNHPGMKVRVFVHYPKMELDARKAPPKNVCDSTDPASDSSVGVGGWRLPANMNYTINAASAPNPTLKKNMTTIVANSFKTWTGAIGNKVAITQAGTSTLTVANSDDGVNLIAWGTVPANALGVTYALFYADGTVAGVDTILSNKSSWSWSYAGGCVPTSYDVQNVLTHEIGHWMGLMDEYTSAYANNTMFGNASVGEIKKDTLTAGDISGLRVIYP